MSILFHELPADLGGKLAALESGLRNRKPLLVAYSGGVDSSCLLALAHRVLGEDCRGVIADSPSLPRRSLADALEQARQIGVAVEVLETGEFDDPRYAANPGNRCYFCKAELFSRMDELAVARGFAALAYGENADDLPATRAGSRAAGEFQVIAPLREAGLTKADIRTLARLLDLPSADLPAAPCLSSRIPQGIPVTAATVSLVERAEASVRERGFRILRVRVVSDHPPTALIQVSPAELPRMRVMEEPVIAGVLAAGFESAEIDPLGYQGAGLL